MQRNEFFHDIQTGKSYGGELKPSDLALDASVERLEARNQLFGDITTLDRDDTGRWIVNLPSTDADAKWQAVIEGVKQAHLWTCAIRKNKQTESYQLVIYAPTNDNIAVLLRHYNYMVEVGLIDAGMQLKYKTDKQTVGTEEGDYKYTSDQLLDLMISRLQNQIDTVPPQQVNHDAFVAALQTLKDQLVSDIKAQQDADVPYQEILRSPAVTVVMETSAMLRAVSGISDRVSAENKIEAIKKFEAKCSESALRKFAKAVATVVIAAVGFVLGAAIGVGIGMLAGAWSGPGAAVTAALGMLKGAATGATIGLAAGTAASGIGSGALAGCLLFSKSKRVRAVDDVVAQAQIFVQKNSKS